MPKLKTYKPLIAAILLVVYAFIATPVQLWHNHNCKVTTTSSKQSAGKANIVSVSIGEKSIENNCQICSHHYSIYNNNAVPAFEVFISFFNLKERFYALSIPLAPYFNSTNKGPPAIA